MSEALKKTFFGGYEKKNTERMLVNLSNKLATTQSEITQQRQQTEKIQNDVKVQMANYEAEIEVKTKIINQLRQRLEEQERQIQLLNRALEERSKETAGYSGNLNRVGEIYAMAYDSAYKIAADAQNSAVEFVETVYSHAVNTQDQLNRVKTSTAQSKSNIARQLDEIKNQIAFIQEQYQDLATDELETSRTNQELEVLKDKAVAKIGVEIQQFTIKNKNLMPEKPSVQPAVKPFPLTEQPVYTRPSQPTVTGTGMPLRSEYREQPQPADDYLYSEPADSFYSTLAMAQRADAERSTSAPKYVPAEPVRPSDPVAPSVPVQFLQTQPAAAYTQPGTNGYTQPNNGQAGYNAAPKAYSEPAAESKPLTEEPEYTNKKATTVKDLLKKYSNV